MYHVSVVEIVDCVKDLLDGLRSILLCEFALFANAVEKLTTRSEFGDNVPLVLPIVSLCRNRSRGAELWLAVDILLTQTNRRSERYEDASAPGASPARPRPSSRFP